MAARVISEEVINGVKLEWTDEVHDTPRHREQDPEIKGRTAFLLEPKMIDSLELRIMLNNQQCSYGKICGTELYASAFQSTGSPIVVFYK